MVSAFKHARERGMQLHKEKPGVAAMRERIWRSMRILRTFTRGDLMAVSQSSRGVTWRFLQALVKHGYLRPMRAGREHKMVYTLILDTGPVPPRPFADGTLFDLNLIPR